MSRGVIALVIMAVALVTPPAVFGQARPDVSGTWRLNFEKSSPGIAGNGPDVAFPSQLVVTQSPTELAVKRTSVRQAPFSAVYKLDGSRVTVEAPAGITETAQATVDGATVVIASRRSFPSPNGEVVLESREIWSVSGNVLTIKKTVTQDGEAQTSNAAYDKAA